MKPLKGKLCLFQEEIGRHEISAICCVVRDEDRPNVFGYATTTSESTAENSAHVFTLDTPVSTLKIVTTTML